MEISHCIILTLIQGLPLNELMTPPLVVQNDASHTHTRTGVSSFTPTGVPVVSLQWFPLYICVCRAGSNLSSAAVLVPAAHNEGSVCAGATAGTFEHAQYTAQQLQRQLSRATFDFRV